MDMIYILYGKDKSMVSMKLEAIKKRHHVQENVNIYDAQADEISNVLQDLDAYSIFDDDKMIIVNNCTFLSSKNTTNYEVDPFLVRKDTDMILVLVCPSDKLDTRKKKVKEISGCATLYSCLALDEKSQKFYVQDKLKEYGVKVDFKTLDWMTSRMGLDPMCIQNEIEKISIYSKHPTLEDVQNLLVVEPMNDIFKMVDAFFSQNGILLLAYYRNFRKLNMQPVAIVALLASQIRFLFQVRVLMDEGKAQATIAQELKANPYRVKLNMQKAMRFSSEALLYNLSLLADFDQQMKMGKIDKDDGFEYFCLNLMMNKD